MRYVQRSVATYVKGQPHSGGGRAFDANLYNDLMARPGRGDPFDRHVLASAIVRATIEDERPLPGALGLNGAMLTELLDTSFPDWRTILGPHAATGDAGRFEIEEEDFLTILLAHRSLGAKIEEWLAHIVVRRSLAPDHLWCNIGVRSRSELSQMLHRHFRTLAEQNTRDMRWKKFFYRYMCQTEGIVICTSPVCDTCPDFAECFGPET